MEQTNHNNTKIVVAHPATLDMLAAATWDFAHSILWRKSHFGEDEVLLSKSYIREHYEDVPTENFREASLDRFNCFCERIMSAKLNSWNETTHPCFWFNKMNRNGFVKTKEEHEGESRMRIKSNREYFEELFFNAPMYNEIINNRYIKFLHHANRNY